MTISFKISDKTKKTMNEFYQDLKRNKTPQYAVFQADDGDTVVTLYESGKVVFQGKDADLSSKFWVETEKINSGKVSVNNSDDKKKKDKFEKETINPKIYNANSIGSDEVGTGDYFGPIVVTSAYITRDDISFLENLGVRDSKKLTDDKILEIVPQIIKKIPYSSITLSNTDYNNRHSHDLNMNKIKAILHNKVLVDLANKHHDYEYVVVDEFAQKFVYYNYLKEVPNVFRQITFMTKAEDKVLSVACASLISRYIFIKEFDKLSKEIGINLPKGAGPKVDEVGSQIVKKFGFDKLKEIAKMNFKNTNKILEMTKKG